MDSYGFPMGYLCLSYEISIAIWSFQRTKRWAAKPLLSRFFTWRRGDASEACPGNRVTWGHGLRALELEFAKYPLQWNGHAMENLSYNFM